MYSYNRPKVHHLRTVTGVLTFPVLSSLNRTVTGVLTFPVLSSLNRTVTGVLTFPVLSSFHTPKILFLYLTNRQLLQRQSLSSISFFDNFGKSPHQHDISFSHEKLSPHSAHFLFISFLIVCLTLY